MGFFMHGSKAEEIKKLPNVDPARPLGTSLTASVLSVKEALMEHLEICYHWTPATHKEIMFLFHANAPKVKN